MMGVTCARQQTAPIASRYSVVDEDLRFQNRKIGSEVKSEGSTTTCALFEDQPGTSCFGDAATLWAKKELGGERNGGTEWGVCRGEEENLQGGVLFPRRNI